MKNWDDSVQELVTGLDAITKPGVTLASIAEHGEALIALPVVMSTAASVLYEDRVVKAHGVLLEAIAEVDRQRGDAAASMLFAAAPGTAGTSKSERQNAVAAHVGLSFDRVRKHLHVQCVRSVVEAVLIADAADREKQWDVALREEIAATENDQDRTKPAMAAAREGRLGYRWVEVDILLEGPGEDGRWRAVHEVSVRTTRQGVRLLEYEYLIDGASASPGRAAAAVGHGDWRPGSAYPSERRHPVAMTPRWEVGVYEITERPLEAGEYVEVYIERSVAALHRSMPGSVSMAVCVPFVHVEAVTFEVRPTDPDRTWLWQGACSPLGLSVDQHESKLAPAPGDGTFSVTYGSPVPGWIYGVDVIHLPTAGRGGSALSGVYREEQSVEGARARRRLDALRRDVVDEANKRRALDGEPNLCAEFAPAAAMDAISG